MYKHLSELIVRVADLAEAEGRVLRRVVSRMGLGVSLTVVAAALVLIGCVLLLGGLWWFVHHHHGPVWACAVTGAVTLGLAVTILWIAGRFTRE